ncbi:MAG: NAD(P)-dependent oxidoreductase [Jatrophihabitans sp.]|uniref:NAD(P)-dependent oxidoreductase n=1 Tax=Jatrophihabitans sp. TaxID=1932789 RepID=UPI00390E3C67
MRVALLGTGTMGTGMARSMRRAGLDVTAWNRTRSKAEPLADDGIAVADSVVEAVHDADVVLTILFDADAVLGVTDEVSTSLRPEAVWLQSATVGIEGIQRIAERAGDMALLDAPVLGTKQPAAEGKLVPLVSGDAAHIDRVRPVLDAIGSKTVVAGSRIGDATALKLAANAWVLSITAATAQSLALADRLGIKPGLFLEAIDGGPSNATYAQVKGTAMLERDFAPAFGLDGGRKDLQLIADAAGKVSVPTALVDGVRALFDAAAEAGHGQDDIAAVYAALRD